MLSVLCSCSSDSKINGALLSGNITNFSSDNIIIKGIQYKYNDTIKIAKNGKFSDTLKVKTGNYYLVNDNNTVEVFIDKGYDIKVTFDANDLNNTLSITGEGANISNYLLQKSKTKLDVITDKQTFFSLDTDEFKLKSRQVRDSLSSLVSSYKGLYKEFVEKEKRNLNYCHLFNLMSYRKYHGIFKRVYANLTPSFFEDFDSLDYNNKEDFKYSKYYKEIIQRYISNKGETLSVSDSIPLEVAYLKACKTLSNDTIMNSMLYRNAKWLINSVRDLDLFYSSFMKYSSNELHKNEISNLYKKLKTLDKGSPSPKFVNYENYAGGTTSLDDLKGKYTYIDVWATWCGPCKREMPFLKKLEEKYHGNNNIQFVSISIDQIKYRDDWKAMIKEKELGGIHLIADKDFDSDFMKEYFIDGIPHFILLDPDGNIVDAKAPRPSFPELLELFNKLKI